MPSPAELLDLILTPFSVFWTWLTPARGENVLIAFGGSALGAVGGAYAAERIAASKVRRAELLQEIRDTNAAIQLAFAVCNHLLAYKGQSIKELVETYAAQRFVAQQAYARAASGVSTEPLHLRFVDFETMESPGVPVEKLEALVLEKVRVDARSLQRAITLRRCVGSIEHLIESRNELIREFGDMDKTEQCYLNRPEIAGGSNS